MAMQQMSPRPDPLRTRVATEVRAWKGRLRMTQAALAKILGVSQAAVSDRLTGKTPFTLDEIDTLAEAFGISSDELTASPQVSRPRGNSGGRPVNA